MATEGLPDKATEDRAEADRPKADGAGLGCGVFLAAAGAMLLAERMGWIPDNVNWLLPVIILSIGVATIVRAVWR